MRLLYGILAGIVLFFAGSIFTLWCFALCICLHLETYKQRKIAKRIAFLTELQEMESCDLDKAIKQKKWEPIHDVDSNNGKKA